MARINAKTVLMPLAACIFQAAVSSAYPTKMLFDLVDESKWDGGDGGCLEGTKYTQVDTISNLDKEDAHYSLYFYQVSNECGQAFQSGDTPYSFGGTFTPGDIEPDTRGRVQLNLYFCAPYGNYEIEIEVFGDFEAQQDKRIGWEIEDGQTGRHIWDTFNINVEPKYNPAAPGKYRWPLDDEDDAHMANYYVGLDPASSECDNFGNGDSPPLSDGGDSPNTGDGPLGKAIGCYPDSKQARVFDAGYVDDSGMSVVSCADKCASLNYSYCGLEFAEECFCGDSLPSAGKIDDVFCTMDCTGDKSEYKYCGGHDAILIYELDGSSAGGDMGPCYEDDKTQRTLNGSKVWKDDGMTPTLCKNHCSSLGGMTLYGLEFTHECFCGNSVDENLRTADSLCNMPCGGSGSDFCGGRDAIRVLPIS